MALIKCTECGKEISDKIDNCIHCGCPIEEMDVTENVLEFFQINKIISYYKAENQIRIYGESYSDKISITNKLDLLNSNLNVIETVNIEKINTYSTDENIKMYSFEFYMNDSSKIEDVKYIILNGNGFKKDIENYYNRSIETRKKIREQEKIKCPTCFSTNVNKISSFDKATNIALFGLLGNKRKMQFQCESCKYMW